MPLDDNQVREQVGKVEALLAEAEALSDPAARAKVVETVQALLDLYGEGLARMMAHTSRAGAELTRSLADDDLVSHLLLLHGLHPDDLATRVRQGLDAIRPSLESHGGSVQLLSVAEGVVRLHLDGSFDGSLLSAATMKNSIEQAIHEAAPDIDRVEAEGELAAEAAAEAEASAALGTSQSAAFVPLSALGVGDAGNGHDGGRG